MMMCLDLRMGGHMDSLFKIWMRYVHMRSLLIDGNTLMIFLFH